VELVEVVPPWPPPPLSSSTRTALEPAELGALFEPAVNVALLLREPSEALQRAVDGLGASIASSLSMVLDRPATGATVPPTLKSLRSAAPAGLDVSAMERDLWDVAELLADLSGASAVGVRLARLDRAMCPRFHVDRVTLRCVVTYLGPGTEWLDHEDVNRSVLGHHAQGRPDEETGLIRAGVRPHSAPVGAAIFLKGEAWPGNGGRGAVHRSPQVHGSSARLVATLDPLD
jgi:hypothetical protein